MNSLKEKIKDLEVAYSQKSAEISHLSQKIIEKDLKINEEASIAFAFKSQCAQYAEEITSLKSKY